MADSDYIKAAVELAEGFVNGRGYIVYQSRPMGCPIDNQEMLDALAAELVRQMDAVGYEVEIYNTTSGLTVGGRCKGPEDNYQIIEPHRYIRADGPDRTMNTLKCIVDSGVLKGE